MTNWRHGNEDHESLNEPINEFAAGVGGYLVSLIAGAVIGTFFTLFIGSLFDNNPIAATLYCVPVIVTAFLAYAVIMFRRETERSEAYNNHVVTLMDKMNGKNLVQTERIEALTVHKDYVTSKTTIALLNQTDDIYNQFRIGYYLDDVCDFDTIQIYRDGERIRDLDKQVLKFSQAKREPVDGDGYDYMYEYDLFIPLNLRPGETCVLEVVQESPSIMPSLHRMEIDEFGSKVHNPTNSLTISIQLDDDLARDHRLVCVRKLGEYNFTIMDQSNNRMASYEARIKSISPPIESDGGVCWKIMNPVTDYAYTLYPCLEKKR